MEKQTTKKKKKDLKITVPLKRQEGQNKNHENLRKDFERETEGERSLEMDEMLTIQVRVAPRTSPTWAYSICYTRSTSMLDRVG